MALELVSIGIAILTFLVGVPAAIQSCIYLKRLRDYKRENARKSQLRASEDGVASRVDGDEGKNVTDNHAMSLYGRQI